MEATLLNLFLSKKESLQKELLNLELPQDMEKLESIINNIFVKDVQLDEYKRNLTNQELTMLDAVLCIIDVPALLSKAIHKENKSPNMQIPVVMNNENVLRKFVGTPWGSIVVGGAVVGGIGSILWNACKIPCIGLGSILCSIIGGVTAYYTLSAQNFSNDNHSISSDQFGISYSLDINVLTETVELMCERLDNIIGTFRSSINYYSQKEINNAKKNLVSDYWPLIMKLAALYASNINSDGTASQEAMSDVLSYLKLNSIEFVPYSESSKSFYVVIESAHVSNIKILKPAILSKGELVENGECLVPAK